MLDFPRFIPWVAIATIKWRKLLERQVGRIFLYLPFMYCCLCSPGFRPPSSSGFCSQCSASSPDRPKLVVLDSFYMTGLFGQTDASQVKHCLLQDGGTQSGITYAEVEVPKQLHLLCHCCWLFSFLWCFPSLSFLTLAWMQIHFSLPVGCKKKPATVNPYGILTWKCRYTISGLEIIWVTFL